VVACFVFVTLPMVSSASLFQLSAFLLGVGWDGDMGGGNAGWLGSGAMQPNGAHLPPTSHWNSSGSGSRSGSGSGGARGQGVEAEGGVGWLWGFQDIGAANRTCACFIVALWICYHLVLVLRVLRHWKRRSLWRGDSVKQDAVAAVKVKRVGVCA
jgi:hypothetical protein